MQGSHYWAIFFKEMATAILTLLSKRIYRLVLTSIGISGVIHRRLSGFAGKVKSFFIFSYSTGKGEIFSDYFLLCSLNISFSRLKPSFSFVGNRTIGQLPLWSSAVKNLDLTFISMLSFIIILNIAFFRSFGKKQL